MFFDLLSLIYEELSTNIGLSYRLEVGLLCLRLGIAIVLDLYVFLKRIRLWKIGGAIFSRFSLTCCSVLLLSADGPITTALEIEVLVRNDPSASYSPPQQNKNDFASEYYGED